MANPSRDLHPEYAALRKEYADFRYHLPDALLEIDLATFQVVYLNRMAEIVFGFSQRDVADGLTASAILAPEEFTKSMEILQRYVAESRATGKPYTRSGTVDIFEVLLRRKDGERFLGESQSSFVLDERGIPVRMLTLVRDVSARRR
jgi:PAS domain S-box-containing protein